MEWGRDRRWEGVVVTKGDRGQEGGGGGGEEDRGCEVDRGWEGSIGEGNRSWEAGRGTEDRREVEGVGRRSTEDGEENMGGWEELIWEGNRRWEGVVVGKGGMQRTGEGVERRTEDGRGLGSTGNTPKVYLSTLLTW